MARTLRHDWTALLPSTNTNAPAGTEACGTDRLQAVSHSTKDYLYDSTSPVPTQK
jgi:hypothetical protein